MVFRVRSDSDVRLSSSPTTSLTDVRTAARTIPARGVTHTDEAPPNASVNTETEPDNRLHVT